MHKIEVIGLGAGDIDQLPLGIYRRLTETASTLFVRTMDHPVVQQLQKEGMVFKSFDKIYESYDQFEEVYEEIVNKLVQYASEGPITYAVPGHPMLAEKTVKLLLEKEELDVEIIGGQSYLDDLFTSLQIDPIDGFQFVDATDFKREDLTYQQHLIFCQVYDAFLASEVKLALLEDLPASYEVWIVEAAGSAQEMKMKVPLEELDRVMEMSNLVSIYIPPVPEKYLHHQFHVLRNIIRTLRGPNGCPWDKKQTHESLRPYLLEEAYELIDAIEQKDDDAMISELGDVLLQVFLHSQIGEDDGYFTIEDVIQSTTEKMLHRHPHVFGGDEGKSWDELKQEEKQSNKMAKYLLDDVIKTAPALQIAYELQRKAAKVGFDWKIVDDIWEKFEEEYEEFTEAIMADDIENMEAEFGDLLFVLANIAKHYKINPEIALNRANKKFISRFTEVEKQMKVQGKRFAEMQLKDLDRLWDIAKQKERE